MVRATTTALLLVGLLIAAALPAAPASAAPSVPVKFGTSTSAVKHLLAEDLPVAYASFWAGAWNTKSGWGYARDQVRDAKAAGLTPVVNWWYWGDDISPDCVEKGCWSSLHNVWKDKATWNRMSRELADVMADSGGIVILENEFNKNGIATYEAFDGYLAEQAKIFKAKGVRTVVGFGFWGEGDWHRFDRAVAASDYAGTMMLRSSVRHASNYDRSADDLLDAAKKLQSLFGKRVLLYDFALSSYPEPEYAKKQEAQFRRLFELMPSFRAAGVEGLLLRHILDNPDFDTRNYNGQAERWWGLKHWDGSAKPAWDDVLAGIRAESEPPAPPPVAPPAPSAPAPIPSLAGRHEAEEFPVRTVGGPYTASAAGNGKGWNIWANGHLEKTFRNDAAATLALTVHAAGDLAGTQAPRMVLSVNGAQAAAWWVDSPEHRAYTTTAALPAGEVTVRIAFTNDYYQPPMDRNLRVDALVIAAPTNWRSEAEALPTRSVGAAYPDAAASGGAGWNLWSNGYLEGKVTTGAGSHRILVTAKGDYARDWPLMRIWVDGKKISEQSVSSTSYGTYTATADLAAGTHTLRIEFANDYYAPPRDRNLRVDSVAVKAL